MDNNSEIVYLYLDDIIPNRFQPREVFDDQALKELAVSIKEHGVIQPIIVRKVENKYEIIAGERRYKASTMAGLTKIPAIVKNLDDKESSKVALIENLQRKDLTPIEEARTYQKILELENNMTQEQLAATMGKTQSSVSNKLRLLALPDEIQDALLKEKISERHARSLLNIEDKNTQIKMMDKVITEKMTVRDLDREIKELKGQKDVPQDISTPTVETTPLVSETTPQVESTEPQTTLPPFENNQPETKEDKGDDKMNSATNNVSSFNMNPTSVDINQIRESAQDIGGQKQDTMDVKDLMKNGNESNDAFKFVPSFGQTTTETSTKEPENNVPPTTPDLFSSLFNANTNKESSSIINEPKSDNSSVASAMPTFGISVNNTSKDITEAKTNVKNTIDSLKTNGYNVKFEEIDGPSDYKITITIEK